MTIDIVVNGKSTKATVLTDDIDEACKNQIQEMMDNTAFRNPVKIMPDAHPGSGSVIGFTMEMGDRVCPNTVGVDIGCGMTAVNIGDIDIYDEYSDEQLVELDEEIRRNVPMGRKNFSDSPVEQDYHIVDDFPWELCGVKRKTLNEHLDVTVSDPDYGKEYFVDLCDKIGYSIHDAINSIGTLGGGNHFIEISKSDKTGDYWVVVHSGSRGIGMSIAQYWQRKASELRDDRPHEARLMLSTFPDWSYKFDKDEVSDDELMDWLQGGMGEDWKNTDEISKRLDGEDIGELIDELKGVTRYVREKDYGHELDYLEGDEMDGYLQDMIFAQTYANESRRLMASTVSDIMESEIKDIIISTHNYIDFYDGVIRKGATRVHHGEKALIPFNMRDGSIIVKGKGNPEWNKSAPHGAGRRGSRRWAFDTFTLDEFEDEMDGIFSTSVVQDTVDEAPMAYKSKGTVLDRIEETATIEETLTPVHNIKADE